MVEVIDHDAPRKAISTYHGSILNLPTLRSVVHSDGVDDDREDGNEVTASDDYLNVKTDG